MVWQEGQEAVNRRQEGHAKPFSKAFTQNTWTWTLCSAGWIIIFDLSDLRVLDSVFRLLKRLHFKRRGTTECKIV